MPSASHGGRHDPSLRVFTFASDDAGTNYLIVAASHIDGPARTELYVIVKQSDYVPGADVALDGSTRMALFATGPLDAYAPEVFAMATTGTVHFGTDHVTPGVPIDQSLTPIDLSLDASFARATWDDGDSTPTDSPR